MGFLEALQKKVSWFRTWRKVGPVEQQVYRDLDTSITEMRQRLDRQREVLKNGNVREFEKVSGRFRNFLIAEMDQALQRVDREIQFINSSTSGNSYHGRYTQTASEIRDMIDNESVRLNNALSKARHRLDEGDNPADVSRELLEIEESEEQNLVDAERSLGKLEDMSKHHRLGYAYLWRKTLRKITRADPKMLRSKL